MLLSSTSLRVHSVELLSENQTNHWASLLAVNCVCPSCGDSKGHAGLRYKEDDDLSSSPYASSGYCVKCGMNFLLPDVSGARKRAAWTLKKQLLGKNEWNVDYKALNFKQLDKTLTYLSYELKDEILDWEEKTRAFFDSRSYEASFQDFLISKGVSWYEPTNTFQLPEGSPIAGMFQEVKWTDRGYEANPDHNNLKLMEYRPIFRLQGLLLPAYREDNLIGFTIRNLLDEKTSDMPRYMNFKTVNTDKAKRDKNAMLLDSNEKYIAPATFLKTNYDSSYEPITNERIGQALYITEGQLKAMAINYYFKEASIGVTGVKEFGNEEVKKAILDSRHKTVVVVPDRDYQTNAAVAMSVYRLLQFLDTIDVNGYVLTWNHPNKSVDKDLKGIDDALVAEQKFGGVVFSRLSFRQFFIKMAPKARRQVSEQLIRPGMVFSEDVIDKLDFVIKDNSTTLANPDIWYERSAGPEVYAEAIAQSQLVVDISPTGTGKSHRAGLSTVEMFQKIYKDAKYKAIKGMSNLKQIRMDFLEADKVDEELLKEIDKKTPKRMKMLELSPLNNTVQTLKDPKKWKVVIGRNAKGWTFDAKLGKYRHAKDDEHVVIAPNCPQTPQIVELVNKRQVLNIQKDICAKCPLMKDGSCKYWEEKKESKDAKYSRMNMSSFRPRGGDVVFCDDWGSINPYIEMEIKESDFMKLMTIIQLKGKWTRVATDVIHFLQMIKGQTKLGLRGKDLAEAMMLDGTYDLYPISQWLELPEPDSISRQLIRVDHSGIDVETDTDMVDLINVKRCLFHILEVFSGKAFGDIYYKGVKDGEDTWIIKGVDPKFKDMMTKITGFMIFDATADVSALERIFGVKPLIISAKANPLVNVEVSLVKGFKNTYKSGLKRQYGHEEVMSKLVWLADYQRQHPAEKLGILTYKELVENVEIRDLFLPDTVWGYWWNDDRASNVFYEAGVTTMVTLGVPIPNLSSVAAEVDAKGVRLDEFVYSAKPYGIIHEDGTQDYIICKDSEDPLIRSTIWSKRSASYIQALGRLRSVQRPTENLKFMIMDDIPTPFPVNTIIDVQLEDKEASEIIVDTVEFERNRKVAYLLSLVTMFKAAIEAGHVGLSENARTFLATYGYEFDFMYRYAPSLRSYFTFQEMIEALEARIAVAKTENLSYLPTLLQSARVSLIKSPEFSSISDFVEATF